MNIEPKPATTVGSADWFTGAVYVDPIAVPKDEDQRMIVSRVRFTPGARTAWHAHGRGQTLHITQGVALIGKRDGTVIRATPGQTIYTPPGEEHWHGATPEDFMEHLAMLEDPSGSPHDNGWHEQVTDEDYRAAADA
jgi:quercetin dioxygenase-like cupin family protein